MAFQLPPDITPGMVIDWVEAHPDEIGPMATQLGMTIQDIANFAVSTGRDISGVDLEATAVEYGIPSDPTPTVQPVTYQPPSPSPPPVYPTPAPAAQPVGTQPTTTGIPQAPLAGGFPAPSAGIAVSPSPVAGVRGDTQNVLSANPPSDARGPLTFANIQEYMTYYDLTDEDIRNEFQGLSEEEIRAGFANSGIQDLSGTVDYLNNLLGTGYGDNLLDQSLVASAPASFATVQDYMDYYNMSDQEFTNQLMRGADGQPLSMEQIRTGLAKSGVQDLAGVTDIVNRLGGTQYNPVDLDPSTADIFQPGKGPVSTSFSGLPSSFTEPLLGGLLPQLTQATADLPGQVDLWTENARSLSQNASRNVLQGAMTSQLADLAKRGVLDSSVAEKAIGRAGADVAKTAAQNAAQIGMQGATLRSQIPGILSGVAGLGQTSTSRSTNELAPYQLYADFIKSLQ